MKKMVLIFGGATLIYLVLAMLMAVLPGLWLSNVPPGPGVKPLTPIEAKGRDVFVANGCSYCHTQQVRPLPQDRVFGRPSARGDFVYQTPELLGSERTGPDLTNIGVRQPSEVWQYIHLYNPRAVVPQSVMPAFNWMFNVVDQAPQGATTVPLPKAYAPKHGVVIPKPEAVALVAYLESLKQPAIPGYKPPATSAAPTAAANAPTAAAKPAAGGFDAARGAALFTAHCAACHQANGEGLPGAFPALKGNKAVNDDDPTKQIQVVLHGLHGAEVDGKTFTSAMPPFAGQLSDAEIADIIDHERSAWGNHGKLITAKQVAAERAKSK